MIERNLAPVVLEALADSPVVFVQGARQTGKSTLVQSLIESGHEATYHTLDDAGVLTAAEGDPEGFIAGLAGAAVIDEVQRAPALFRAIKAAVDRDRRAGRFLLTGSASVRVLPALAEALVGRVQIETLWPFSQDELEGRRAATVDRLFGPEPPAPRRSPGSDDVLERVIRGGFPEAVARGSLERRHAWFRSYVTTILQRDVRDMSSIEGLAEMPRLLSLLAARCATVLNAAELSRSSGIAQTTLKRYLALLDATFLVQLLPAWTPNIGKRMIRAPKVLPCDSGLVAALLGIDADRLKSDADLRGRMVETFVAMELRKQSSWSAVRPVMHHFRTHAGREVDLVLEASDGRIVGVEVKSSRTIGERDLAGLRALAEIAGARFHRGILLYAGDGVVPFAQRLHAIPIDHLWSARSGTG